MDTGVRCADVAADAEGATERSLSGAHRSHFSKTVFPSQLFESRFSHKNVGE